MTTTPDTLLHESAAAMESAATTIETLADDIAALKAVLCMVAGKFATVSDVKLAACGPHTSIQALGPFTPKEVIAIRAALARVGQSS